MKTWIKIILGLFVVGFITAVWVYVYVYNKSHPDYEKMKPDYTLSASELYNSFKANTTGSGKKFNGKILAVSGTVNKVETVDSLVIVIFVFNQGIFGDEGIRCTMLPSFNVEAKKLRPDNVYKIKGFCSGYDTDVNIEHCSIVK
jgi:hypothetical protein